MMTLKKIVALILVIAVLAGGVLFVATAAKDSPNTNGGLYRSGFTFPSLYTNLLEILLPPNGIYSDGLKYPLSAVDAKPTAKNIIEGESLPAVGDMETLLKLLKDRGALYDGSAYRNDMGGISRGVFVDIPDFEISIPMEVPLAPPPSDSALMDMPLALAEPENAGAEYSQTNEQVAGVSEGDIVKTDGRYIYAMSQKDNKLRIIKANEAELEVVSIIANENICGAEFYLIGTDRLVIVGSEILPIENLPFNESGKLFDEPVYNRYNGWYYGNFTVMLIYDISDRAAPGEVRRISMDGWNVSTRVIGNVVYLVTNKSIWNIPFDHADSLLILPFCRDTTEGEEYAPIGFGNIFYIPDTNDTSYLLIGAVDVYGDEPFEPNAYLGAGSSLYMSQNAIYITQGRWQEFLLPGETMTGRMFGGRTVTDILRFAIGGTDIIYTGKGSVDGSPINQYSMDEYKGYFRIATTDWNEGTYVTILDTADMKTVGRTEPLAPREQMRSMRFVGDMGYVVTFENVDPLFTIDLSDPFNPVMLGELKIPGFSQYLHPVGDGLMLGIGRDTQEIFTRDSRGVETVVGFRDTGMKVSLFDVSDPFDPIEVDILVLGAGWAEVSDNPRALMCDSTRGLYGYFTDNWGGRDGASCRAILLQVENGRLSIAATLNPGVHFAMYGSRLCFIGDTLYLVHNTGVAAFDYNSFERLGSISF